jgi:hypothetical protein
MAHAKMMDNLPPPAAATEGGRRPTDVGALGMVERMEVKVLCGACRRQPRAEGNCTR